MKYVNEVDGNATPVRLTGWTQWNPMLEGFERPIGPAVRAAPMEFELPQMRRGTLAT